MNRIYSFMHSHLGLANRFYHLRYAIQLARNLNRQLTVYWPLSPSLNISHDQLFTMDGVEIVSYSYEFYNYETKQLIRQIAQKKTPLSFFSADDTFLPIFKEFTDEIHLKISKDSISNDCDIVIGMPHVFKNIDFEIWQASNDLFFQKMKINPDILKSVGEIMDYGEKIVGVHYRKFEKGSIYAPVHKFKFIKSIRRRIDNGVKRIFISSDDLDFKHELKDLFGEKIICQNNSVEKSARAIGEGIKEAFIDLLCLGCCDGVIGTEDSSFSLWAMHFKNSNIRRKIYGNRIYHDEMIYRCPTRNDRFIFYDYKIPVGDFQKELKDFSSKNKDVFFVQIGACDGKSFDPLRKFILENKWKGLLVEPIPYLFEELKKNYEGQEGLLFENSAITETTGTSIIQYIPKSKMTDDDKPFIFAVASLKNEIKYEGNSEECEIQTMTLKDLLEKYDIEKIDILQIDAEGYDAEIATQLDLNKFKPRIVNIEHTNLTDAEFMDFVNMFESAGYRIFRGPLDITATLLT